MIFRTYWGLGVRFKEGNSLCRYMVAAPYKIENQRTRIFFRPPILTGHLFLEPVGVAGKLDTFRPWCITINVVKDETDAA